MQSARSRRSYGKIGDCEHSILMWRGGCFYILHTWHTPSTELLFIKCLWFKQVLLLTKKTIRLRMIWPLIQATLGMLRRLPVICHLNRSLILTITAQKYLLKVLIILTLHMIKLISNVIKFCCCCCCCIVCFQSWLPSKSLGKNQF